MLKSLVWKESRELIPMVVLLFILQYVLVFLVSHQPWSMASPEYVPFVGGPTEVTILFVAALGGAAIGLRQATREASGGTYLFLLHRPATREAIFGVKLLMGLAAVFLLGGLPLLARALWAATPGTHASPFLWAMTSWAWVALLQMPLFYLAGFLSGLRSARWLGTRLLPLAAGILAYAIVQGPTFWPWSGLALCALLGGVFIVSIRHVAATQDYS